MSQRNLSSGQFPTMGESAISVSYTSPAPGKLVPRNIGKMTAEPATAAVRPQVHETHGYASGGVKVWRDLSNSPEAASTGRNIKPMAAARGGQAQFDARRCYGQGL